MVPQTDIDHSKAVLETVIEREWNGKSPVAKIFKYKDKDPDDISSTTDTDRNNDEISSTTTESYNESKLTGYLQRISKYVWRPYSTLHVRDKSSLEAYSEKAPTQNKPSQGISKSPGVIKTTIDWASPTSWYYWLKPNNDIKPPEDPFKIDSSTLELKEPKTVPFWEFWESKNIAIDESTLAENIITRRITDLKDEGPQGITPLRLAYKRNLFKLIEAIEFKLYEEYSSSDEPAFNTDADGLISAIKGKDFAEEDPSANRAVVNIDTEPLTSTINNDTDTALSTNLTAVNIDDDTIIKGKNDFTEVWHLIRANIGDKLSAAEKESALSLAISKYRNQCKRKRRKAIERMFSIDYDYNYDDFTSTEIIKLLIAHGFHPDFETLKFFLSNNLGLDGYLDVLIEKHPNIPTGLGDSINNGTFKLFNEETTLLIAATINNRPSIVNYLIKAGADLDATDNKGDTALIYATRNNYSKIEKMLLDAGATDNRTVINVIVNAPR